MESNISDAEKINAGLSLLDKDRPLEYQWLNVKLRARMGQLLPDTRDNAQLLNAKPIDPPAKGTGATTLPMDPLEQVSVSILYQNKPTMLYDISFAEIRFTNHGEKPIHLRPPIHRQNYWLGRGGKERRDLFDASWADRTKLKKVELMPGESLRDVCASTVLSNHFIRDRYPDPHADKPLETSQWYPLEAEFEYHGSEVPNLKLGARLQPRAVRKGNKVSCGVKGVALASYLDSVLVHGFRHGCERDFSREFTQLIDDDTVFPWDATKWTEVRPHIHPDSALMRMLKISEKYAEIIKSSRPPKQKFDAVMALPDKSRRLEHRWLTRQLTCALKKVLPNEVIETNTKN